HEQGLARALPPAPARARGGARLLPGAAGGRRGGGLPARRPALRRGRGLQDGGRPRRPRAPLRARAAPEGGRAHPRRRARVGRGAAGGPPALHTFPRGFSRPIAERPPGGGLAPRWLAATALAVGRDNDRPIDFGDPVMTPVYHVVFRHFMTPFDSDSGRFA